MGILDRVLGQEDDDEKETANDIRYDRRRNDHQDEYQDHYSREDELNSSFDDDVHVVREPQPVATGDITVVNDDVYETREARNAEMEESPIYAQLKAQNSNDEAHVPNHIITGEDHHEAPGNYVSQHMSADEGELHEVNEYSNHGTKAPVMYIDAYPSKDVEIPESFKDENEYRTALDAFYESDVHPEDLAEVDREEAYVHGQHSLNDDHVRPIPVRKSISEFDEDEDEIVSDDRYGSGVPVEPVQPVRNEADEFRNMSEVSREESGFDEGGFDYLEDDHFEGEAPKGLEDEEELVVLDAMIAAFQKSREEEQELCFYTANPHDRGEMAGVVTGWDDDYVLIRTDSRSGHFSTIIVRAQIIAVGFEFKDKR